jgi:hypothetical protein
LVAFDCPAGNEQRDAGNPIEHTPDTAPYFHNNSAKTLDEVLDHYSIFFSQSPMERSVSAVIQKRRSV